MNSQSREEIDVSALYQQLLDAWNKRDAAAFAMLFAEDGSSIGFDGSQMNGRAEIAEQIGQIFADHQTARYIGIIREVRVIMPEVAILRAVSGMVPPGQTDIKPEVNTI